MNAFLESLSAAQGVWNDQARIGAVCSRLDQKWNCFRGWNDQFEWMDILAPQFR